MSKRQTLEAWIHEVRVCVDNGKCTAISLVHKQGIADQEVHVCKLGDREISDKELADLFQNKAQHFGQDLPGVQTFCLLAFYDNANEPTARHPFVVHSMLDYGGLTTEPPDDRGMRQQGMRLLEGIAGGVFKQVGAVFQASERMLEISNARNVQLQTENQQIYGMLHQLIAKQLDREHEHAMAQLQYQRQTEEREKLLGLIPSLTNTITGKEIFPQSREDTAIIEEIARRISPEQLAMVGQVLNLPSEMMGLIAHRFTKVVEDDKRKRAVAQVAANGKALPEAKA